MNIGLFIVTLESLGYALYKRYIDLFFNNRYRGNTGDSDCVPAVLSSVSTSYRHDHRTIYYHSNPNTADVPRNPRDYRQYRPRAVLYFTVRYLPVYDYIDIICNEELHTPSAFDSNVRPVTLARRYGQF